MSFIAKFSIGNQTKKASTLYLSKEANSKDLQLKSQMVLSLTDDESKGSEKIWKEFGFFKDQRVELTISKANFPENTLAYINQGSLSVVKGGEKAIYLDFVILGQIMPIANPDPKFDIDDYVFQENEAIIYCPVYNKSTGLYGGLTKKISYIALRGDPGERFFSYSYNKEKSSLHFSSMKTELPNILSCTAFKKHISFLIDQNQDQVKFSKMFLYLPSTLDRKEDFLQWKDHVHLHPIDLNFDDMKVLTGYDEINPALLDVKNSREKIVSGYYKLMKKIAEVSNQNLVQNSDAYLSGGDKTDPDNDFNGSTILINLQKRNFN